MLKHIWCHDNAKCVRQPRQFCCWTVRLVGQLCCRASCCLAACQWELLCSYAKPRQGHFCYDWHNSVRVNWISAFVFEVNNHDHVSILIKLFSNHHGMWIKCLMLPKQPSYMESWGCTAEAVDSIYVPRLNGKCCRAVYCRVPLLPKFAKLQCSYDIVLNRAEAAELPSTWFLLPSGAAGI